MEVFASLLKNVCPNCGATLKALNAQVGVKICAHCAGRFFRVGADTVRPCTRDELRKDAKNPPNPKRVALHEAMTKRYFG